MFARETRYVLVMLRGSIDQDLVVLLTKRDELGLVSFSSEFEVRFGLHADLLEFGRDVEDLDIAIVPQLCSWKVDLLQ